MTVCFVPLTFITISTHFLEILQNSTSIKRQFYRLRHDTFPTCQFHYCPSLLRKTVENCTFGVNHDIV